MIGPFYLNFVHVGNRVFSTQQYLDYSCLCVIPILINLMSASLVQDALYNFFLQMNVFLWISLIGSYSQCPLIINCWHDEIPEFHWSKLGETQNFKLRSPIRWRESGISQIKISEHLFASIIWFIKHKLFKVKMTCNCVGINYRCLIVYVANDTNYTVQRCNYFHHKHLPAELTEDLTSDFVSIREVLLFNLQPLIAADTNSNC